MPTDKGANAGLKVASLVGGMVAGADSIDDMALLRHGGMGRVFARAYAPSTLGSFLRAFTFGHVRQLDAVASRFLIALAGLTRLLASAGPATPRGRIAGTRWSMSTTPIIEVHGHAKQGAGFGYSGVRGPQRAAGHLATDDERAGDRGAAAPQGRVRVTARREAAGRRRGQDHADDCSAEDPAGPGADGLGVLRPRTGPRRPGRRRRGVGHRADGQAQSRPRSPRSATTRGPRSSTPTPSSTRASGRWISRAEVAEVGFTAFAAQKKSEQVPGRLVVRRIPDFNAEKNKAAGQDTLFDMWRFHAFFTTADPDGPRHRRRGQDPPRSRDHRAGPRRPEGSALAHLPSGVFTANAAWLVLAVIAFNLTRAAASLTEPRLAKATTATIRRKLITVPARVATSARRMTLHLPKPGPGRPPGPHCSTGSATHPHPRDLTTQQPPARPEDQRGTPGQRGPADPPRPRPAPPPPQPDHATTTKPRLDP